MGFAGNWRRITPSFEDHFRILTFDQRGHGRSFRPTHGFRPEDYAGDLAFLLTELKLTEPINLVGHSMGGRNALAFTHLYPRRVQKLVIEDIGPDTGITAGPKLIEMLEAIPTPFDSKLRAKEFLLNEFGDPKLGQFMYANLTELPDGRTTWRFEMKNMIETIKEGRIRDRWDQWDAITCPTLVIRGDRSHELPQGIFDEMLRRNAQARGVVINNAGHWVHFDQPQKFIESLSDFLTGTNPQSVG
jgi:pimeloyl-ACP methyl ester carboxylesterase